MTTVLFIDIDGCCHPNGTVAMSDDGKLSGAGAFCWVEPFLELLQELPHVDVVVHSTWRLMWETDEELKAHLPPPLAARVVAATPRHVMSRHASIEAYCAEHRPERIVILDDEPSAFPEGLPGLVACDGRGLSSPETLRQLRQALSS